MVELSLFNLLIIGIWQEELDWTESLIKRYVGREVWHIGFLSILSLLVKEGGVAGYFGLATS